VDQPLTIAVAVFQPPAPAGDGDVRLVEAARAGDGDAFDELYRRYRRLVHGVLLSRVAPADAEDLLQDVFLQAWRQLHGLRASAAFGGWLVAMARHRAIDHLRARPQVEPFVDAGHAASAEEDVRAAQALAAIRTLPEAYRETLLLRLVEGMTGPEIARQTGLTPGSVRVNLCRGMKLLRERLAGGDSHVG
jgi:RNA polymerase sigma-70 factor (ECF subfamily)